MVRGDQTLEICKVGGIIFIPGMEFGVKDRS